MDLGWIGTETGRFAAEASLPREARPRRTRRPSPRIVAIILFALALSFALFVTAMPASAADGGLPGGWAAFTAGAPVLPLA